MKRAEEYRIRNNPDLGGFWDDVMGPWGFDQRSVWLTFLTAEGAVHPVIVPIDDVPRRPDQRTLANLGSLLSDLVTGGRVDSVAALFARPGPAAITKDDRAWARGLAPLTPRWPVHLATRGRVRVFTTDDLIAA